MTRIASLEETLRALCSEHGCDYAIELATGNNCFWSAQLRITPLPGNPDGADRSYVTYATGHETPDAAYTAAWQELRAWLAEHKMLSTHEQETRS